jgi:hypothetical protein
MSEILSKLDGDGVIAFWAISLTFLTIITAIIAGAWVKVRRTEATAVLKQDMLNRGMSSDQIRAVLDAGMPKYRRCCG